MLVYLQTRNTKTKSVDLSHTAAFNIMPRKTKSAGGSLGRSLVKSRNKKKANRRTKLADRKARSGHRNAETGQYEDYGGMTGLTSVTELNSLDEFISHARMADRQFATERNQVTVVEDSMIGGSDAALGRASAVNAEYGATNAGADTVESLKVRFGKHDPRLSSPRSIPKYYGVWSKRKKP